MLKKYQVFSRITAALAAAVMLFMVSSCRKDKTDTIPNFSDRKNVPGLFTDSVTTLISDSGRVRYKVVTEVWKVFDKADDPYWYFPEKVYFERFDDSLVVESVVEADTARYFTSRKLWQLRNNVTVMNLSGEKFQTNLLYWDQNKHKIYSDSFIRIEQADQLLMGYGFESNEQLTNYRIFRIKGVFPLDSSHDSSDATSIEENSSSSADLAVEKETEASETARRPQEDERKSSNTLLPTDSKSRPQLSSKHRIVTEAP